MTDQRLDHSSEGILAGRYQVQRQLGKTAGRRTLLAIDRDTQTPVVIKLLLFGSDFAWDALKLFEREAEILRSLSHPAIPRYLDYFELNSTNYNGFALVQTYIEAKSLEDHLKAGSSFSEAELKQLAIALLDILMYLHGRQPAVIHRDIKPSNILLRDRPADIGSVYLVDFGSVQTLAASTGGTITVVGTYGYMPPEQFGGRAVPASDLYSIGATLIYLATGQHPADLPQTDLKLEFERAARLSPAMIRWLKRMTAPSLNQRYASAALALQALEHDHSAIALTARKPAGSRVQLHQQADQFDLELPPSGFNLEVASLVPIAISWNLFVYIWTRAALAGSGLGFIFALFSIPFWGVGIGLVRQIVTALLVRTRLQIDPDTIAFSYETLGIQYNRRVRHRQNIIKLIYAQRPSSTTINRLRHQPHNRRQAGKSLEMKPRLILWVGTENYEIGSTLTEPELDWLAQELSDWLDLPVTRE